MWLGGETPWRLRVACLGALIVLICVGLLLSETEFISLRTVYVENPRIPDDSNLGKRSVTPPVLHKVEESIFDAFRVREFQEIHPMCNGDVRWQSAFCDNTGSCRVTGIANTRGNYKTNILKKTIFLDENEQVITPIDKTLELNFVGDNHNTLRDTFYMEFKVQEEEAKRIVSFNASCYGKKYGQRKKKLSKGRFPVAYRERQYIDKMVMMVSQYYSPVDIEWIEVFLKHYITIGTDYIALYTGFPVKGNEEYSASLDKLINEHPLFRGRIARFEWSSVADIRTWSYSQTAMLNHGANVFWGATIFHADLDEILYPVQGENIKSMAQRYTDKWESWAFRFHSYRGKKWLVTGKLQRSKYHLFDFKKVYKKSRACHGTEWHPNGCRAKYMYRSLNVEYLMIHLWSFRDATLVRSFENGKVLEEREFVKGQVTYCDGKWMNESDAVLLHMRGIQGSTGFSSEYTDKTAEDTNRTELILGAFAN